ncbi:hypothetical protein ACSTLD_23560, partial [Vibrio parahaemolyticus]
VAGVVNIITFNPLHDEVGQVDATMGTQHQLELSGVKSVKLGDRVGVRLSAGGWNVHPYDTALAPAADPYRPNSQRRTVSIDTLAQVTDNV